MEKDPIKFLHSQQYICRKERREFIILHPVDGNINTFCKVGKFMYKEVFKVTVDSITEAFRNSQNDFSSSYRAKNVRSTSVGDIIKDGINYYMIEGRGFKELQTIDLTPSPQEKYVNT